MDFIKKCISKYKDILMIGIILITYVFALINFNIFANVTNKFFALLSPFIYGFVLAYLLNPLMVKIEKSKLLKKIKKEKTKHSISIFFVYVIVCILLFGLIMFVVPETWASVNQLIKQLPNLGSTIENTINDKLPPTVNLFNHEIKISELFNTNIKSILDSALKNTGEYATYAFDLTKTATSTIFNIVMAVIISLYMLIQKDTFLRQSKKILFAITPNEKSKKILKVLNDIHTSISKFLVAKIIDSAIIAILCYIGVSFINTGNHLSIATIVGVTNIIPYFGPFIGAIPSTIIILATDPIKALIFVGFIIALQQFDGNILGPKLLGDSLNISAFWIIFAVVMMSGFFGIPGMIIGVPIFAVIYALISDFIEERLKKKNINIE